MTAIATPPTGEIHSCAGVEGNWRNIVSIDVSAGDSCPAGWTKSTYS